MNSFALWICLWPSFNTWHNSWRWWGEVQREKEEGEWILKYILSNRLYLYFTGCYAFASWGDLCNSHVRGKAKGQIYRYFYEFSPWAVLWCRVVLAHVLGLLTVAQRARSAAAWRQVAEQHPIDISPNTVFHSLSCLFFPLLCFLFMYFSSVKVVSVLRVF